MLFSVTMAHATAQEKACSFNTVTPSSTNYLVEEVADDVQEQADTTGSYAQGRMSVEDIERLIAYYEKKVATRDSLACQKPSSNNLNVLSYADWAPRELNLESLKDVLGEVGLSNKLFVLAQAVLETGNFSSHVCKEYNNLFGLYDSKSRDYYRFASWEDSVVGYKRMIQYRYRGGN